MKFAISFILTVSIIIGTYVWATDTSDAEVIVKCTSLCDVTITNNSVIPIGRESVVVDGKVAHLFGPSFIGPYATQKYELFTAGFAPVATLNTIRVYIEWTLAAGHTTLPITMRSIG